MLIMAQDNGQLLQARERQCRWLRLADVPGTKASLFK